MQCTCKNLGGIVSATNNLFGDNNLDKRAFNWSGGNYASSRTTAATKLIDHIRVSRSAEGFDQSEAITLVGHSHGGNVSIEALNMMAEMEEFDGIELNLLSINTPVRDDYQLSEKAGGRVNHVNVYDPKDPVQVSGGHNPWLPVVGGEKGSAGRTFHGVNNIQVDNPQGIIKGWVPYGGMPIPQKGDFHNSHNRTNDWVNKTDQN